MNRAAIYARYSCEKQSETSLEDQIRRCRETALHHGLIVDDDLIFTDSALSGKDDVLHKRTGYNNFSQAWVDGKFDVFLVDEFSRMTRDAVEQAVIMRRLDRNRRVRMISADGIDTNDADWQLRLGIQGVLAQQEIRKTQHRVGRGMVGQLERGYMIATPAYGYNLNREFDSQGNRIGSRWSVNLDEAAIVKQVFAKREAGQSMHQIAAWLNTSGVACSRKARLADGGFWRPARVKVLLANTIYKGEFLWHGSTTHLRRAEIQGVAVEQRSYLRSELRLVSDETWQRCNTKSHSRSGYGGGKHALGGLMTCGFCGGTLVLSAMSRCRSVYCATCTVAKSSNDENDRLTGTVAVKGVQLMLVTALKHFLTPSFVDAFRNSLRLRLTGDNMLELKACKARLVQLQSAQERLSFMLTDIQQDDPMLTQRYRETLQKVNQTKDRLMKLEAGSIALNTEAIQAQLQVDPLKLLEGLFDADVAPERLRAMLARLFPSIVFEEKTSRYTSIFRIRFATGAALALASDTETIDNGCAELRFQLHYKPDGRSGSKGIWSVDILGRVDKPAQSEQYAAIDAPTTTNIETPGT